MGGGPPGGMSYPSARPGRALARSVSYLGVIGQAPSRQPEIIARVDADVRSSGFGTMTRLSFGDPEAADRATTRLQGLLRDAARRKGFTSGHLVRAAEAELLLITFYASQTAAEELSDELRPRLAGAIGPLVVGPPCDGPGRSPAPPERKDADAIAQGATNGPCVPPSKPVSGRARRPSAPARLVRGAWAVSLKAASSRI